MKNKNEVIPKPAAAIEPTTTLAKVEPPVAPVFVEAEKMFEKLAAITTDIASRAFEFFRDRGGEFGKEVEDWFRAENEILRPVPIEMTESGDSIFVTAAVPGFKPEEIEVSVKDNTLILSGNTEAKTEKKDATTVVREWSSNRFCRQLNLPSHVVADKVTAKLADGMLELTLPKAAEHEATKVAVASV